MNMEQLEKTAPSTDHTEITLWIMGFTASSRKAIIEQAAMMWDADPIALGRFIATNAPTITERMRETLNR